MVDELIYAKVESVLENIRPFLETDGGNIELVAITKEMIAEVRFLGNCVTCKMNESTLKAGVESSIRTAVPEIKQVIAIN